MLRRLLLFVSAVLLLVGGAWSDWSEACAAVRARACCCKAATPPRGSTVERVCGCGCKVEARAPAPARVATRAAPEREPAARLAVSLALSSVVAPRPDAARLRPAPPRGDPLRLDRHCVWRI